jgi:glycosyltransferase involved in cell wall biosynthesis
MRRAQEVGIADHLLLQQLPFEDVPAVFAVSRLVVVPTEREGLGISVLEAMALRKPVVATDAEGIREIVRHENDGYLYAAGEADHLAQIMLKLLRDPAHSGHLGDQGHAKVSVRFSDVAMAAAHEYLYRSLLP